MDSKILLAIGVAGGLLMHFGQNYIRRMQRQKQLDEIKKSFLEQRGQEDVAKFLVEEIEKSEALLKSGQFELGVEHLTNVVLVCAQPDRLMEQLESILPLPVLIMLIAKLHRRRLENANDPQ